MSDLDSFSHWNDYLKVISVDTHLSKTEQEFFRVRFDRNYMTKFENRTINNILDIVKEEKLYKDFVEENPKDTDPKENEKKCEDKYNAENYKKHFIKIFKKFEQYHKICYGSHKDRTIDLQNWLKLNYKNWKNKCRQFSDKKNIRCWRLDEILRELNYIKPEADFRETVNRLSAAGAFFIRADNDKIQNWLVKRLFLWIPKSDRAKPITIHVDNYLRRDFDREFWRQFAEPLQLSEPEIKPERIIDELCEFSRTQPLIVVMSGVRRLKQHNIDKFFHQFWQPLVDRTTKNTSEHRSPIVLFLTEAADYNCTFEIVDRLDFTRLKVPMAFAPLSKFETADVMGWLGQPEVSQCFEAYLKEDGERRQVEDLIENGNLLDDRPHQVLDDMCWLFGIGERLSNFARCQVP